MNPKKLIVPVLCVLLGCAGGAAMGSVTAQNWPEPANVQRWQQQCNYVSGTRSSELAPLIARRGEEGWELVGVATPYSAYYVCFKRPAP